jgi:hypothetical protein
MTNQQLYFLCGTIALSAGFISNSLPLAVFTAICFLFSILLSWTEK